MKKRTHDANHNSAEIAARRVAVQTVENVKINNVASKKLFYIRRAVKAEW